MMQKRKIDELISHFNLKVADMDIDMEYKMELLGMITAIGIACEKELSIEPERKTGKWEVYKAPDKYHCGLVKCPFCGEEMIAEADEYNFCPNCGSEMRGDEHEID